ncbi:LysR family transcriptional regulator [Acuticoccus sediminis]|uniref:LysR family transcriptional regulator n=1 Tax=Acuticoccus sediminis TaxID=2184697 RepID=UPI001CFF1E31|nr:LysR family transcriptional regulator [Acuticoccus sediminis]
MQTDALTLKQLRALVAVSECAGVTAAADKLRLTAPAVSMQLKSLETLLGVELFDRPAWTPNAFGRELIAAARRVDWELQGACARIAALQSGKAGRVVFGVTSTGKYFTPGLMARVNSAMPELDLSLVVGNREAIMAGLAEGRIDFAICGRPPRVPIVDAAVLGDHPHVWITPPSHPLARLKTIVPAQLMDEVFLIREPGSGTRMLMERLLARAGDTLPARTIEFDSNETIKQAVIAGLGIAFLSAHTITAELDARRLTVLPVAGTPVVRQWFLIRPVDRPPSGALARVIEFVVGLNGAFLPAYPRE